MTAILSNQDSVFTLTYPDGSTISFYGYRDPLTGAVIVTNWDFTAEGIIPDEKSTGNEDGK